MSKSARLSALLLAVSLAAMAQVPPLGVISGRVTGDGGAPVANARVIFRGGPYDSRLDAFTDASGRYSASLFSGTWQIDAGASGYVSQLYNGVDCSSETCPVYGEAVYVERGTQRTIDFALLRTPMPYGTITGRVTDEATGRPIALSGVQAFREHGGGAMFQVLAANDGRYSLRVPAGRYLVFSAYGGSAQPPYIPRSGKLTCATTCVSGHEGSIVTVTADATQTVDHRMSPLYIRDVTPRGGPAAGGTTVRINGSGFDGSERVRLGTTEVRATLASPTQLTFTAPAGSGSADIVVSRSNGYTAGFPFPWTWHDATGTYVTLTPPPAGYPRSGETANATLTLSRPQSAETRVAITAPGAIPAMTVTVPAGATSAAVPLRAQRGSFEVTATLPESLGGSSSGFAHGVTSTGFALSPESSRVPRNTAQTFTATLATAQPVDTIIELNGQSTRGLPEAVVIPADQTSVTFPVVVEGQYGYVFARPPVYVAPSRSAEITTFVPTSVAASFNSSSLRYGDTVPLTLRLSEPLPRAATITFRDQSNGALGLPAEVPVPAGVTEVPTQITMQRGGVSSLTAAILLDGEERGSMYVSYIASPTVSLRPDSTALDARTGQTATVTVSLDAPLRVDLPFTIGSDRTRLDAPLSGVFPAGATSASFVVTARAAGTVSLTVMPESRSGAQAPSATFSIAGPRMTISTFQNRRQFAVGEQVTLTVEITPASPAAFTATISTTDAGMWTNLPATLPYGAGDTIRTIVVRVARAGRSEITVSTPTGLRASIDLVGGNPLPPRNRPSRRR